jgi:hypothetical protein
MNQEPVGVDEEAEARLRSCLEALSPLPENTRSRAQMQDDLLVL